MRKQLVCVLTVLTAAVLLSGCNKTNNNANGQNEPTVTVEVTETTETQQTEGGEYSVLVVDENDNPLSGAIVQFCTDSMCNLGETGDDGIAVFAADKPGAYTVHIQGVPDGFAEDETEYVTEESYGQLKITLKSLASTGYGDVLKLRNVGIEFTLPEEMKNLKGVLDVTAGPLEEGERMFVVITYIGRSREEMNEFNRKWLNNPNYDDEEEFNAYMADAAEFYNTVYSQIYYIVATNQGESAEEIGNLSFGDNKLSERYQGPVELGKAGEYEYFLFTADESKTGEVNTGDASQEIIDEYKAIVNLSPDEVAKNIKVQGIVKDADPLKVGDTISFDAIGFDGNKVNSADIFAKNELTMVNLWGTTCHWCIEEMPDVEKLKDDFAAKGCEIIGVCQDGESKLDLATAQLEACGVTFNNYYVDGYHNAVFNLQEYPTSYFVDKDGKILAIVVGAKLEEYKTTVDSLLGE